MTEKCKCRICKAECEDLVELAVHLGDDHSSWDVAEMYVEAK